MKMILGSQRKVVYWSFKKKEKEEELKDVPMLNKKCIKYEFVEEEEDVKSKEIKVHKKCIDYETEAE